MLTEFRPVLFGHYSDQSRVYDLDVTSWVINRDAMDVFDAVEVAQLHYCVV